MKVGDLVRRVEIFDLQYFVREFGPSDIGVIVNMPENMGNVVDIMVKEKIVRYWQQGLEVVTTVGCKHEYR